MSFSRILIEKRQAILWLVQIPRWYKLWRKKKNPERHETGVTWWSRAGEDSLVGDREHIQREYWASSRCLMFGVETRCGHLPLHLAEEVSLPNQQWIWMTYPFPPQSGSKPHGQQPWSLSNSYLFVWYQGSFPLASHCFSPRLKRWSYSRNSASGHTEQEHRRNPIHRYVLFTHLVSEFF